MGTPWHKPTTAGVWGCCTSFILGLRFSTAQRQSSLNQRFTTKLCTLTKLTRLTKGRPPAAATLTVACQRCPPSMHTPI
eukprot:3518262-Amphidinium_carterae.1